MEILIPTEKMFVACFDPAALSPISNLYGRNSSHDLPPTPEVATTIYYSRVHLSEELTFHVHGTLGITFAILLIVTFTAFCNRSRKEMIVAEIILKCQGYGCMPKYSQV